MRRRAGRQVNRQKLPLQTPIASFHDCDRMHWDAVVEKMTEQVSHDWVNYSPSSWTGLEIWDSTGKYLFKMSRRYPFQSWRYDIQLGVGNTYLKCLDSILCRPIQPLTKPAFTLFLWFWLSHIIATETLKNCNYTRLGILCQRWDKEYPHKPHPAKRPKAHDRAHNFCRNPDNDFRGHWCYTINPRVRWEYCIDDCKSDHKAEFL